MRKHRWRHMGERFAINQFGSADVTLTQVSASWWRSFYSIYHYMPSSSGHPNAIFARKRFETPPEARPAISTALRRFNQRQHDGKSANNSESKREGFLGLGNLAAPPHATTTESQKGPYCFPKQLYRVPLAVPMKMYVRLINNIFREDRLEDPVACSARSSRSSGAFPSPWHQRTREMYSTKIP